MNGNNALTLQTRNESFAKVVDTLGQRQKDVYRALIGAMTANELAIHMYEVGLINDWERNKVHPRLNELVAKGVVTVVGKRLCSVSGRKCALYARVS